MNIRKLMLVTAVIILVVAGCGGGGASGGPGTAGTSTPNDVASAIGYQFEQVSDFVALIKELKNAEIEVHEALDAKLYEDWDEFWQSEYPSLVVRLKTVSENLEESEEYINSLVYSENANKTHFSERVVPIPIVVAFIAVSSFIYLGEQERLKDHQRAPTQNETDSFLDNRTAYWEKKGLEPVAARTRAIAESGQIKVLQGLDTGIDHAIFFVTESGVKPGFGQYLPDEISTVLDMQELKDKITETGKNLQAILTSKMCSSEIQELRSSLTLQHRSDLHTRSRVSRASFSGSCRVYFCSTEDGVCPNLPGGDWEASVFLDGYLRDVDRDVLSVADESTTININPVEAGEIEKNEEGGVTEPTCVVDWFTSYGNSEDLDLSGDSQYPTMSINLPEWTEGPIISIEVLDEERFVTLYHVTGNNLPSTIQYGDYSITGTSAGVFAEMFPSPAIETGVLHQITIDVKDKPGIQMGFYINGEKCN